MLIRLGRDLRYRFISRAYAEVTGRRPEAVVGRTLPEVIGEENFQAIRPYVERVLLGERVEFERELSFPRLGRRVMDVVYTPDLDDTGQVIGWIASLFDVTERKRATETERMLVSELQHRSNNLLTVVQAIAQRSLAGSTSLEEARQTFQARLNALARTNNLLLQQGRSASPRVFASGHATRPRSIAGRLPNAQRPGRSLISAHAFGVR